MESMQISVDGQLTTLVAAPADSNVKDSTSNTEAKQEDRLNGMMSFL